jgi:hypothetical protein
MVNRELYVDDNVGLDQNMKPYIPLEWELIIWKSGLKIGYYWQMILLLSQ